MPVYDKWPEKNLLKLGVILTVVLGFLSIVFQYQDRSDRPESVSSQISIEEITQVNGNRKIVVLTFDGGSLDVSGQSILETLDRANIKTTFFLTGKFIESNPELVKNIVSNGHEVFNHTFNHPHLTEISDIEIRAELDKTDQALSRLVGRSTKPFFRAPYGDRNDRVRRVAHDLGYQSVFWGVDVLDWQEELGFTASQSRALVLDNLKPGQIFLLHLGDNISGRILPEVIAEIKARGYDIVPLTEGLK